MSKNKKSKRNSNDDFFSGSSSFFEDQEPEVEVENFEQAANEEVSQYMLDIREATKKSQKSLENQWNTDFYFCAYFADQEQRDEFLKKAEALGLVKDNFINGAKLAEALGIELENKAIEVPRLFAPKKDWLDITM